MPTFSRYVAIGDSTTEGLDDPDGRGGYRGWADRLAGEVARTSPGLLYANLAVRGRTTLQVEEEQLGPALALEPDLMTIVSGVNDVLRPGFDAAVTLASVERMWDAARGAGATVLSFTMPDPTAVMPVARPLRGRLVALNDGLRALAGSTGVRLLDLTASPLSSDARLWAADRLHASSLGHERVAAGLAATLGLPGADGSWAAPLPALPARRRHQVALAELDWTRRHLLPWAARHARGRSSGDGVTAKRPHLSPVDPG